MKTNALKGRVYEEKIIEKVEQKSSFRVDDFKDPKNWGLEESQVSMYIDPSEIPLFDPKFFFHSKVTEHEDLRPATEGEIMQKAREDAYGHNKLRAEEYLRSHCSDLEEGFPFICLRLPDVIGPYDGTVRYWAYMKWLKFMQWWPIHFEPVHEVRPLSFVSSEDVTTLIVDIFLQIQVQKTLRDQTDMENGLVKIQQQKFIFSAVSLADYNSDFLKLIHG